MTESADSAKRPRWIQQRHELTAANNGIAPTEVHNASTYRTWGCRCDTCVVAMKALGTRSRRRAHARTAANAGVPPTDIVHGPSAYRFHRCRCEVCVAAVALQSRLRRTSGKEPPNHGASGYANYGCRCPACTEAWAVRRQKYRKSSRLKRADSRPAE